MKLGEDVADGEGDPLPYDLNIQEVFKYRYIIL
jgi:hypothetical protein